MHAHCWRPLGDNWMCWQVFFFNLSPGGKKQVIWCFSRVSDIPSASLDYSFLSSWLWCCRVWILELLFCTCWTITELLSDEQYDAFDWLDVPWFGTVFKLQNMQLMKISHFRNSTFGRFGVQSIHISRRTELPESLTNTFAN
jgi:hypothetical protein